MSERNQDFFENVREDIKSPLQPAPRKSLGLSASVEAQYSEET